MDDKQLLALLDDPSFTDQDFDLLTPDEKNRLNQLVQPPQSQPSEPNILSRGLQALSSPMSAVAGMPLAATMALGQPIGQKIEETAASGLRGIGAGAGALSTGASPAEATIEASRFIQDPRYSPSSTTTSRNLAENIGAIVGEGFSPANLALGESLGAGVRAVVPPVVGRLGGMFGKGAKAMQAGEGLVRDPLATNLIAPAAKRESIAAARQGITDLAGDIDSLTVIEPITRGINASTRSAGTKGSLQKLLRDVLDSTDPNTGKIPASRAQEIISDFDSTGRVFGKEIPTRSQTFLQKVVKTAQGGLEKEVPGLRGINEVFKKQYHGRPFEPFLKPGLSSGLAFGAGMLGAGSGLGALTMSPRLVGLGLQGVGLGLKAATSPAVTGPAMSALRRMFLTTERSNGRK